MNYVLISIGTIPEYIKFTLNTILSVDKDANIFLCSDQKNNENYKNVNFVNIESLKNEKVELFKNLNLYKETIFESNPLWEASALRVFYLESIKSILGLDSFVHFDNDVLIYKPFHTIKNNFSNNKFNITKASDKHIIFGYSYISEISPISEITEKIIELSNYGQSHEWSFNYGKPYNEMDFLARIFFNNKDLFNCLPILPYESQISFDPSSYGQFLDGTHLQPKKFYSGKYVNINHHIGTEIISKRIRVKFQNNKPEVIWRKKSFDIANLHIHSKRLNRFLPKEYKDYV